MSNQGKSGVRLTGVALALTVRPADGGMGGRAAISSHKLLNQAWLGREVQGRCSRKKGTHACAIVEKKWTQGRGKRESVLTMILDSPIATLLIVKLIRKPAMLAADLFLCS